MIAVRKISLPNGRSFWCLLKGAPADLDRIRSLTLVKHEFKTCSSEIFIDESRSVFVKAPPVKWPVKDNLVKFIGWTSADKEFRGGRILGRLGLKTNRVLVRGIPLNPFGPYRSLLYSHYIKDSMTLYEYLRSHPDAPQRRDLLDRVSSQLAIMYRNGVSFRDFYFGNILFASGELIWIDTEVQRYRICKWKPRARFLKKMDFMFERFLRTGGKASEWERFSKRIIESRK